MTWRDSLWRWACLLVLATGVLTWAGTQWHARAASARIRFLAVLPFRDLTLDANDWLAPGLTGEIIDDLSRAPGLEVVARTSARLAKGEAARQLDVAAVLEGSIRRTGRNLHVAFTLTRKPDGYRLWSASFDRPAQELGEIEEAIASAVAGRLQVRMPAMARPRHPPSEEAYEAYLQGRQFFDQRNPEALNQAAARLEDATRLAPDFVRAWAWLSIVREYRVAAALARPNQAMPASRDAAERAVALDAGSPDAHLALGIVKVQYDWDWAAAKAELDRALAGMPGSAFVREWLARWYETQGRTSEAMAELERALRSDPLSGTVLRDAAAQYLAMNLPDRALAFAQKAANLDPGDAAARVELVNALLAAGDTEKSRQVVEALRASPAAAKLAPTVLAGLEARLGDADSARELLDAAEDLPDDELLPAVRYAELAGSIEDWDRLFSWMQEAYGERDVALPYWRGCPLVPKSDPRFEAFLAEMNLPAAPGR